MPATSANGQWSIVRQMLGDVQGDWNLGGAYHGIGTIILGSPGMRQHLWRYLGMRKESETTRNDAHEGGPKLSARYGTTDQQQRVHNPHQQASVLLLCHVVRPLASVCPHGRHMH